MSSAPESQVLAGLRSAALRLASSTALGQGAMIITAPLVSRLYSPAEIGGFGLLLAFVGFASVVVGLRLDLAIVDARSDSEADNLLRLTLVVCLPLSALAAALMLLMRVNNWFAFGQLAAGTSLATLLLLIAAGTFTALRFWHVRRRSFNEIGGAVARQGIARAVLPVLLGLIPGVGMFGLVVGELGGRLAGIGQLARDAWPRLRIAHRGENVGKALWRHRRFPLLLVPSSGIDALAAALPLPLIAQLYDLQIAGEFALVQRIASAPAALLATSVADVVHSRLAARHASDDAGALLTSSARLLLLVSLSIYVPAMLLSPWLFGLVFGARWAHAGWVMVALSPLLAAALVVSPLSRALVFADRLELKLLGDIVGLLLPIGALLATAYSGSSATVAIAAYAAGGVGAQLTYFLLIRRAVR